ncbi:MAG: thioredoxin family protein [Bacteroidia bacterium]|nr:thioredoxin family protein [Bacteroidia bacterium]
MAVTLLTDAEFQDWLQKHPKVIVKFFANWCGNCKLIAGDFRKLSENPEFQNISFVDINAEENPITRKLAGVSNLPFIAVFLNGNLLEGCATSNVQYIKNLASNLQSQ